MRHQLDAGEAECLAVAITRGFRFFSDDLVARKVARHRGVVVSGTLGVLAKLVDSGRLTLVEGDKLLSLMITSGYRSPLLSLEMLTNN